MHPGEMNSTAAHRTTLSSPLKPGRFGPGDADSREDNQDLHKSRTAGEGSDVEALEDSG
jgi:hypothetical protein